MTLIYFGKHKQFWCIGTTVGRTTDTGWWAWLRRTA